MYKNKKEKTDQEWEQIKYRNNVGIQIGACINKAVDIVVAETPLRSDTTTQLRIERIKYWTDVLFEIGTDKKKKETTPQPVSNEEAVQAGIEFKNRYEKDSKLGDINQKLNEEADNLEDQQHKWGADNNGRQ